MRMASVSERFDEPRAFEPAFSRGWKWLLLLAVVQLLAGAAAIAVPQVATVVVTFLIGWLLLIAAVFHLVHAFAVRMWRGFVLHLLGAVLYGVAGALLLLRPVAGAATLTLLLAGLFLAEGGLRALLAWRVRPFQGWGWMLASAIASIVLGGLLLIGWPASTWWAIGLLLGVNLALAAAANFSIALACRRQHQAG